MTGQRALSMVGVAFFFGLCGKMEMGGARLVVFLFGYACLKWFEATVERIARGSTGDSVAPD